MNSPDSYTLVLFILPSLFGMILIGEGVQKIMNYDNHGWIGVSIGGVFLVMIIVAYLMFSSQTFLGLLLPTALQMS